MLFVIICSVDLLLSFICLSNLLFSFSSSAIFLLLWSSYPLSYLALDSRLSFCLSYSVSCTITELFSTIFSDNSLLAASRLATFSYSFLTVYLDSLSLSVSTSIFASWFWLWWSLPSALSCRFEAWQLPVLFVWSFSLLQWVLASDCEFLLLFYWILIPKTIPIT